MENDITEQKLNQEKKENTVYHKKYKNLKCNYSLQTTMMVLHSFNVVPKKKYKDFE